MPHPCPKQNNCHASASRNSSYASNVRPLALATHLMCLGSVLVLGAQASGALAQAAAAPVSRSYDIPAGPLNQVLTRFSSDAGIFLVGASTTTEGKTSPGLKGSFTAQSGFTTLLVGTGLEAFRQSDGSFGLRKVAVPDRSEATQLAPVTVTGERSERTVFDTSSSVQVVTVQDIGSNPGQRTIGDVLERIPNITATGTQVFAPAIRGINSGGALTGGDAFYGGALPRATITLDGRPLSYNEYVYGDASTYDLERVEVFRGPQTTFQGANSIAGAIHVVTSDPSFKPERKARIEAGSNNHKRFSAAISQPILDKELAVRLAIDYQRRDSFVEFDPTVNYGGDPGLVESKMLRGKLLWRPAGIPGLETKLTFNFSESAKPQTEEVREPYKNLIAGNQNQAVWKPKAHSIIHDISYQLSDGLKIENRFSATDYRVDRLAPAGFGVARIDGLDLINETRLHIGKAGQKMTGVVGTYLQSTKQDESINYFGVGSFNDRAASQAFFGEATLMLTERFDITAGLRYQRDRKDRNGLWGVVIDYDKTFAEVLPKFAVGYFLSDNTRIGAVVSKGYNPGGTTASWHFDGQHQTTFGKESVWNYEIFSRSLFLDGRLAVNTNLFYSAYRDYQRYLTLPSGDYWIDNVDKARSYGLEVSADWHATHALRLFAGIGLLATKFTSSSDSAVVGKAFARAPDFTMNLGTDYQLTDELKIGGQVRHSSRYYSEDDNNPDYKVGGYTVADIKMSYRYRDAEIYGYINNVFGKHYLLSKGTLFDGISAYPPAASVGRPREIGVGVSVQF